MHHPVRPRGPHAIWVGSDAPSAPTLATVPTSSLIFLPRRSRCFGKMELYSRALLQLMLYALSTRAPNQSSTCGRAPAGAGAERYLFVCAREGASAACVLVLEQQ